MPIIDGWLNVFRLDDTEDVQLPDSDLLAVGELFGGAQPASWLSTTVDDALEAMNATGTDRAVLTVGVGSVARSSSIRLPSLDVGLAACRKAPDRFRLVVQIQDVSSPHAAARLVREHAALDEVVAVGVYPAYLDCDLGDRRMYPFYDACVDMEIPARINLGIAGPMAPSRHQHPELLEDVLLDFPDLTVIGCHMGHPYEALLIRLMMKFPRLFLMTSGYLAKYFDPAVVRFMDSPRGRGRVLWGSDHPGIPIAKSLAEARRLPLQAESLDEFLGDSLGRIVGWK